MTHGLSIAGMFSRMTKLLEIHVWQVNFPGWVGVTHPTLLVGRHR